MRRLVDFMAYPPELPEHLRDQFEIDLTRTVIHEAGHAVVLHVCSHRPRRTGGVRDVWVRFAPESLADPWRYRLATGECRRQKDTGLAGDEWRMWGLAGVTAEAIWLGVESADDLRARLLDGEHGDGLWLGRSDARHANLDDVPWTAAHLVSAWDLLVEHWPEVLAVGRMVIARYFSESEWGSFYLTT